MQSTETAFSFGRRVDRISIYITVPYEKKHLILLATQL